MLASFERGTRLLTLTGPGGSGKTRLAIEAATTLVPVYKAGVFWVGLAAFREPSLVTDTIAQTLGARDGLAAHIGEREMLLLLDNLEQVIEAAPELAGLLRACPNLTLLCTSRELLRVQGEVEYPVPPLASAEAVDLFCERSRLEPSEEVAELCARLDDLPLAVELAAARTKALSPAQILERISGRLDLLRGGRDAEARQQTLRATIAWSYDLLSEEDKRVFRALSVFVGGCTLEAAEAVADASIDTLQSLVEKSLLRSTNERYWMLETIREYALGELARSGEAENPGMCHTEFFLDLAEELLAPVGQPTSDERRERFMADQANFREAHTRVLEAGDGASAVRFVRRLGRVMSITGSPPADSYARGIASLALPGATKEDRAYALVRTASCADALVGEYETARALLSEAEKLFEELRDQRGLADAIAWRANVESRYGNYEDTAALGERLATIGEALDDPDITQWAQNFFGLALFGRAVVDGDRDAAQRNRVRAEARVSYDSESDSSFERAASLGDLAFALFAVGEYPESIATAQRSLRETHVEGTTFVVGLSLCGSGDFGRGVTLIAAARRQLREDSLTEDAWVAPVLEPIETAARAELGDDGYDASVRAGEALSRSDAIELALAVRSHDTDARRRPPSP